MLRRAAGGAAQRGSDGPHGERQGPSVTTGLPAYRASGPSVTTGLPAYGVNGRICGPSVTTGIPDYGVSAGGVMRCWATATSGGQRASESKVRTTDNHVPNDRTVSDEFLTIYE